jgi:OFA family oxalate/formate antiporter-like MFS transporter
MVAKGVKSARPPVQLNQKLSIKFYGWRIVAAGFFIWLLTGGFIALGFTAFFEPIVQNFGWTYAQVSLAASLRGVELGLFAPVIGLLVDRWGPRKLIFAGLILAVIGLLFLSQVNSLGMFYLAFIIIAVGMSGTSPTVIFTALAHWFKKRLGIAAAIAGSGFALGGVLVPVVVKLIDRFDWRITLCILAAIILIICVPLSLMFRHKPEQYGYLPDGEIKVPVHEGWNAVVDENTEDHITSRQILSSRTFWHIGLATMFHYFAIGTIMIHVMPYLSSVGVVRSTASLVAMAVPLFSIPGRLISGTLGDKFNKKQVATIFFSITVAGLLCLLYSSSELLWLLIPFIICFGIGWGSNNTLRAAMIREYFGRNKFGTVLGFMMGLSAVATIIGPFFAGWVFDTWGNYQNAWFLLAFLVFASVIIIATTPPVANTSLFSGKK